MIKNDATCIVPVDIYGEAGRGGEEKAPREEEEGEEGSGAISSEIRPCKLSSEPHTY